VDIIPCMPSALLSLEKYLVLRRRSELPVSSRRYPVRPFTDPLTNMRPLLLVNGVRKGAFTTVAAGFHSGVSSIERIRPRSSNPILSIITPLADVERNIRLRPAGRSGNFQDLQIPDPGLRPLHAGLESCAGELIRHAFHSDLIREQGSQLIEGPVVQRLVVGVERRANFPLVGKGCGLASGNEPESRRYQQNCQRSDRA